MGVIHKPVEIFEASPLDGDLKFTLEVKDAYKKIDAGLTGGVGYKFKKEIKSMAVGINYYYGLVDVSANPDMKIKNSATCFPHCSTSIIFQNDLIQVALFLTHSK